MTDIDEIVRRNRDKTYTPATTSYAQTHETATPTPDPVQPRKTTGPSKRHILIAALILGLIGLGIGAFAVPQFNHFTHSPTPSAKYGIGLANSDFTKSIVFTNSTLVTMYLVNTGNVTFSISTIYIKDASGNQETFTGFQQIAPYSGSNAISKTNLNLSFGTPANRFSFISGNAYYVTVVLPDNSQQVWTIVP